MNNIPIEIICPICGQTCVANCIDISCENCKFDDIDMCNKNCTCNVYDIIKEQQSQIYQFQIENQSLLHECNGFRTFFRLKGGKDHHGK